MTQETLRDFFRDRQAKDDYRRVDWAKRKLNWIRALNKLYADVLRFLDAPIRDGSVIVLHAKEMISEDYVGEYQVPLLRLQVGNEKVDFTPIGMNIVGAIGRVELRGDMGEVTIVRQPKDRWSVVASRTPTLKLIPLNEQSLLEALKTVMRP